MRIEQIVFCCRLISFTGRSCGRLLYSGCLRLRAVSYFSFESRGSGACVRGKRRSLEERGRKPK